MNVFKRIQILVLGLLSTCSCGSKKTSGTLPALDKKGNPIICGGSPVTLEWYKTTDHATMIELQKKALPILAEAFADEVKDFLLDDQFKLRKEYAPPPQPHDKTQQEKIPNEDPFIANARLDRKKRVKFARQRFEQWLTTTAQLMKTLQFTYFLVLAKNNKNKIIGVTAFYISPSLPAFFPEFNIYKDGDVVLDPLAIFPNAQGIGLARPLVFSILKLAPEIKRILVGTRIWITNAIEIYKRFGFIEYEREGIAVKFKYVVKN